MHGEEEGGKKKKENQISFHNKLDHISNTAMYNVESYFYNNKDIAIILIKLHHLKC
jgi:hypothetical protein